MNKQTLHHDYEDKQYITSEKVGPVTLIKLRDYLTGPLHKN